MSNLALQWLVILLALVVAICIGMLSGLGVGLAVQLFNGIEPVVNPLKLACTILIPWACVAIILVLHHFFIAPKYKLINKPQTVKRTWRNR